MAWVIRIISDSEMSYMDALRFVELAGVLEHPEYLGHHCNHNDLFRAEMSVGLSVCSCQTVYLGPEYEWIS